MAIGKLPELESVGRRFSELVHSESAPRMLWLSANASGIELWLLTDAVDLDTMRRLHEAGLALEDSFPDAVLQLHVLNPTFYPSADPTRLIPAGAVEMPLRPE